MKNSTPNLPGDSLAAALLAAARVVLAVSEGRTLDAALAVCWQKLKVEGPARAAIQDLAYGTLRLGERPDFFLRNLLRSPLPDPLASVLLRVTLFRLEQRPQDAHTTVDQAVAAMGVLAHGRYRSLANAVLRNFLRQHASLSARINEDEAACWQHPQWWIAAVKARYPTQWQSVLTASNQRPPMTLRTHQGRGVTADTYVARLAEMGIEAYALDACAVRLAQPQGVDRLPGFAAGDVSVQDWGAQHAARLLDVQSGMRVLDACAAPGGKTCHVLETAAVDMTALELDPTRGRRIDENLERLGLQAKVLIADSADTASWWDGRPFDRILADVPCSASGVVRRHPDIKWLRRAADLHGFASTQARIVDALWQTLAPGGTMLYCTCSIFGEENDAQVEAFLKRHPDAVQLPINQQPHWQLLPTAEHDGFYYARLQKRT